MLMLLRLNPTIPMKSILKAELPATVRDNGEIDDSVVTFESALSSVVELTLSDDYEIQFVSECDGGSCRRYVVAIDNGD